jgi:hypothetical protein
MTQVCRPSNDLENSLGRYTVCLDGRREAKEFALFIAGQPLISGNLVPSNELTIAMFVRGSDFSEYSLNNR